MNMQKRFLLGCVGVGVLYATPVFALPSVVDVSEPFSSEDASVALSVEQQVHTLQQQLASYRQMHLPERIDDLNAELQKLRGQLEEQAHALQQLRTQQPKNMVQSKSSISVVSPSKAAKQTHPAELTEKDAYQAAFRVLRAKKYTQAVHDLQNFIKRYPESNYVANAHYWLGEIYFLQGQFAEADTAFNTIVTRYPGSNKIPDTLLKRGLILQVHNKQPEAKKAFQYIVHHFPGTSAARLATLRLQS